MSLSLDELAEKFVKDYREGKKTSVEELADQNPEFANEIRELFPALLLLEKGGNKESVSHFSEPIAKQGDSAEPVRINDYRIIREIGHGGMGIVYEACDESLDRLVALKLLRSAENDENQAIQRFLREAKMAAAMHHTNIVPVYDSGVFDGKFYYVMQLIEGISIEQLISKYIVEKFASSGKNELPLSYRTTSKVNETNISFFHRQTTRAASPGGLLQYPDTEGLSDQDSPFNKIIRHEAEERGLTDGLQPPHEDGGKIVDRSNISDKSVETPKSAKNCSVENEFDQKSESSGSGRRNTDNSSKDQSREDESKKENSKRSLYHKVNVLALLTELNNDKVFHLESFDDWCESVCRVGIQVCQALEYAHRHHVLHRDIKPSNLLLDEQGIIWITDFGLAKPMEENNLTQTGQLVGTLRYMAPEGLDGEYLPQSDIYSLGLTLYEMLTLTPAFGETNYSKLIGQISDSTIISPRKINRKIPRDLETIILKATERESEKRYQTAAEFNDDLLRFLEERPIKARRVSSAEMIWRWCRRNRLTSSLLLLSVMLVFLLLSGMTAAFFKSQVLLAEKDRETLRAKTNLNLAISAFDDIFSNYQGMDENFSVNRDEGDWSASSLAEGSLSEKDIRVLESLLNFYDRFAMENGKDQKLLMETGIAHTRIGRIQQQINRTEEAQKSIGQALKFFLKGIDLSRNRNKDIIRAVTALNGFISELNGAQFRLPAYISMVDDLIELLSGVPDIYENQPQRNMELARLYWYRAINRMNTLINIEYTVKNYDGIHINVREIFDSVAKTAATELEKVKEDLKKSRLLLDMIRSEFPQEKEAFSASCWQETLWALYLMIIGQSAESFAVQDKAVVEIERLIRRYPKESQYRILYIRLLQISLFTSKGDLEKGPDRQNWYLEKSITLALELCDKYRDSVTYASTLVQVYYVAATNCHARNDYRKAENYYEEGIRCLVDFERRFALWPASRLYVPLHCCYANLLAETGRKDQAKKELESVSLYMKKQKEFDKEKKWSNRISRIKGTL